MEVEDEYWNLKMIEAEQPVMEPERRIKVAVIDSGIDWLTDVDVSASINLVDYEEELPYYMNDMTGHGTAVGSIIRRINPQADIISVRVLDNKNQATLDTVIKGIYWCIDNDVDIINMSFGTLQYSKIFEQAITDAQNAGILLVAAAGNCGQDGVEYPAAFDGVVAVGGIDCKGMRSDDSSIGEQLEIVAPGENVPVESFFGMETAASGTSMASPHVAGAASVLWQLNTDRSSDFIRRLICQCAKPIGNIDEYGQGVVDLDYALDIYDAFCEQYDEKYEGSTQTEKPEVIQELSNDDTLCVYDDSGYVEGRWGSSTHKSMITDNLSDFSFSSDEVKLLKAGSVYPDKEISGMKGMTQHPEWHGYFTDNYVACYIGATKIAKKGGDTSNLTKAQAQSDTSWWWMTHTISASSINGKSWKNIISDETGLNYNAQTDAVKKKWRKAFLYGMTIHTLTDVFAHSCYTRNSSGVYSQLTHERDCDNPSVYANRAKCAKGAASVGLENYDDGLLGDPIDFAEDDEHLTGFYIKSIINYAIAANPGTYCTNSEIQSWFANVNYN